VSEYFAGASWGRIW